MFKLAILSGGNGVGFELFEFVDPKYNGPEKRIDWNPDTYTRGGVFHFCLTVPDVVETAKKAVELGGKQVGEMMLLVDGEKAIYMQDPWGNVCELLSCGIEFLFLKRFMSVSA